MAQAEQMLAADADLAGELRGGLPLGDTAEDQKDLRGAQVSPLPGGVSEHVEDPPATLAAVIGDRRVGTTAVDVETLGGATAGTGEPFGVEQIEELLVAPLLVHEVDNREIHGAGSGEMKTNKPRGQETKSAGG
jgi:hypothetical protein